MQDWYLIINNEHHIKLTDASEKFKKREEAKEGEINFKEVCIEDIRLIPNLMKTKAVGVQCYENENSYIISSGIDKKSGLPFKNTWNMIKRVSSLKF